MIPDLSNVLYKHYLENDRRRWKRIDYCPLWIVPDLLVLFTNWNPVIDAMKANLHSAKTSGTKNILQVMMQTHLLHQQMARAIEMREVLRIHQAITNHVIQINEETTANLELHKRLKLINEQMSYNTTSIDTIKDQLQNLIQLVGFLLALRRIR
jgi:hypothetical protein